MVLYLAGRFQLHPQLIWLVTIITWAKKIPEFKAVFIHGSRAEGTAKPDSEVALALSIKGREGTWRLATFISHRRAWRAELEAVLGSGAA
jgi:predicted nucleotidyltransferase